MDSLGLCPQGHSFIKSIFSFWHGKMPFNCGGSLTDSIIFIITKEVGFMFSRIMSAAILGMEVALIHVEVDIAQGLPGFILVGYLSSEVKEAGERVRVALKNAGVTLPPMRITVNLAPANVRKEGTAFDLPIALGILKALGNIPKESTEGLIAAGELGLNGSVNPVRGVLPFVRKAKEEGNSE